MAETHDMEMTCVGSTHDDEFPDCTFACRITASSHEEGLRKATELHEQERKEQETAYKADSWNNPLTICGKPMFWVYPEPCWDCVFRDPEFEAQMAQEMVFFANIALHGMPRPN